MIDYSTLPEHMQESMRLYIEQHVRPGSFLLAVLENNLMNAFAYADHINTERLRDYSIFLFNEAPTGCHGSPLLVERWLENKQEEVTYTCQTH